MLFITAKKTSIEPARSYIIDDKDLKKLIEDFIAVENKFPVFLPGDTNDEEFDYIIQKYELCGSYYYDQPKFKVNDKLIIIDGEIIWMYLFK